MNEIVETGERVASEARRAFLKRLGGGAGAAAVAVLLPPAATGAPPAAVPPPTAASGYRETAHVRAYYQSADR